MRLPCFLLLVLYLHASHVIIASDSGEGPERGPLIEGDSVTETVEDVREHGSDPDDEDAVKGEGNTEELRSERRKRFVTVTPGKYWLNGIVPYVFLDTLTEDHRISALAAMKFISDNTCIRYVPWDSTTRAKYGLDHDGHMNFDTRPGEGCTAGTGNSRDPDGQLVKCCDRVTCSHELGHVLGWGHEQQSIERDGWVRINWQNITSDMREWYRKKGGENEYRYFGYDISSTMHYLAQYGPSQPIAITVLFPELPIERAYFYYFKEIALTYQCHEKNCSHFTMTCHNEGFVTMVSGVCQCYCPDGLDPATGCQTVLKQVTGPSQFPGGKYVLLAPSEGCPGDSQFQTGSLVHYHYRANNYSPYLLAGSMGGSRAEQHFCVHDSPADQFDWPAGDYCILRSGGVCPPGFGSGYVQYDNLPPTSTEHTQASGAMPDGTFVDDVRFEFCCRDDGFPEAPLSLPNTQPLILFRHKKGCHPIAGMSAIDSFIWVKHSDTETGTDVSSENRPIYFHYSSGSVYVGYCHYTPLNKNCGEVIDVDANTKTATFTSPGYPVNYANNLDCHWIIRGPENSTLVLNIGDLDIEQKSGSECVDELKVNHAKIGHKPRTYCGTERRASIGSITNMMSIELLTTYSGQRRGFSAMVTLHLPEEHCYDQNDKGVHYRGKVNFTRDNEPCLPWTEVAHCYHSAFHQTDLDDALDGNYCRNPGDGLRPWCYTQAENCARNYCDVCKLERPFDNFDDCSSFQAEGLCSDGYLARKGCTKTCQQDLPATETPVRFSEVTCSHPQTPPDATRLTPESSSYSLGSTITYKCNTSSVQVTATCLSDGTWTPVGYVCGGCPSGWHPYKQMCHKRFEERKNFAGARVVCALYGGKLAAAKSVEDSDFLFDVGFRDGDEIWIGLSDDSSEGNWKWEDNTALSWSNWMSGRPITDKSRNCARVDTNKEWKDVWCGEKYFFVCSMHPGDRLICTDRRTDCGELLTATPSLCKDQPDFAWFMCPSTCGACGTAMTVSCPTDWTEYGGSCYNFQDLGYKKFDAAEAVCAQYGAKVATAKDDGEYNFIRANIKSQIYWLGAHDRETEGVWNWVDGTPLSYNHWTGAEPDNVQGTNTDADCLIMDVQGRWLDNGCSRNYRRFVCKKKEVVQCPSGWVEFNGACYAFHGSWVTYAEAEAVCASYGDDVILTTTKSEEELNFTKSIVDPLGQTFWISMDDRETEGVFKWADGTPVVYNAWTSQPDNEDIVDGVTVEADCVQVAQNGLWNDISCERNRRFICKMASRCVVPEPPANAIADSPGGSLLSRGQYVTYMCKSGYVPVTGNAKRTCQRFGAFTGSGLVCGAEGEATTESNTVRLMDHQHVGDATYSYTGTAEHLRISRNGHVTAWRFYSNTAGQVAFRAFRPRPDLGSNRYELVGQNVVTTRANRIETVSVDSSTRIQVQKGDVLGIYYGQTPGGVPFENCQEAQTPAGLSVMRSKVGTSNPASLTPGTVVEFDNSPTCLIFSFKAIIGP